MPDCCRKYREEKLRKSSHIRSDSLRSIPAPASEIPLAPGFRTSRWISSGLCRIAAVNIGKKNSERAVISDLILCGVSLLLLRKFRWHPAFVLAVGSVAGYAGLLP